MKEYVPGQGSYKVEEAGALTGIGSSYGVDNHFGSLTFDRDDVKIKARGVDFALSSLFNSDHLYSTIMPIVSKSDGPTGTPTPVPLSLMTLPFNQANFYRICNGWSWKLPFFLTGANATGGTQTAPSGWDILKYADGSGKIFDLLAAISQEAWDDGHHGGGGNHCWTEGCEVTYAPEVTSLGGPTPSHGAGSLGYSKVTIIIPEIQQVVTCWVIRSGSAAPYDFAVNMQTGTGYSPPVAYLSDGKKIQFTSKGLIASVTDPSGKNTLSYSYMPGMDALINTISAATSRKSFTIQPADYTACAIGDLIIMNDEVKVISAKIGGNTIQTSSNFDIFVSSSTQYTIVKGQLQMITHTDGRAVKFYYFASGLNMVMAILLSSDQVYADFNNGDQFLGIYTIDPTNRLIMYQNANSLSPGSSTNFPTALSASPSTYYTPLQQILYSYQLTLTPQPSTDFITVVNNAGAPTVYYFQAGGFCTHLWNNSFFHTGKCRRAGTQTMMNIERPDFYIGGNAYNYMSINRINQNAFYDASKADYQKDRNAAEFQEENNFNAQMMAENAALAVANMAEAWNPLNLGASALAAAGEALQVQQYAHQLAKASNDAYIASHAAAVSAWALVTKQVTSSRVQLTSPGLSIPPMQNDVYGCVQLSGPPNMNLRVNASSQDSTKVYIDYTNGGVGTALQAGDYIFIRGFMSQIQAVGTDTWAGASEKYVMTADPLPFSADEGEYVMAVYIAGGLIPNPQTFYGYYLNKPKCVRIEFKSSAAVGPAFWKRIDYEYSYKIQGESQTDSFDMGGFDASQIEGPEMSSFELSDIKLISTTVMVSEANASLENDLYQDIYTFSYDIKDFHKGQDSVARLRFDAQANTWLFVNGTVYAHGRPCFNAGYYGVTAESYYEGGDVTNTAMGGTVPRKSTGYRFDVYGRKINERLVSPSLEGRKIKNTWFQYVCTSQDPGMPANWDLDPLYQFKLNYLSSTYGPLMNSFHALGVIGATIEEVDAQQNQKVTFNEFDGTFFNLVLADVLIVPTLIAYTDLFSVNSPNWEAVLGSTIITDPSQLRWSPDGNTFNPDMTQLQIGEGTLNAHMLTYYTYDAATNNLIAIQKPMGNSFNITYGSGWASSYIASDYKAVPNNIGGTLQYIVNLYTYDIKGRMLSKKTVLSTDIAGANPYSLTISPSSLLQFTYDGADRLLTKAIGNGSTQTVAYQALYMDLGDGMYEGPYMVETDYLGFRTKTFYDCKYRVVSVEKFKPSQAVAGISGGMNYANSIMANGKCNMPTLPPSIQGQSPAAPVNGTFAFSAAVGSPNGISGFCYQLVKTSAPNGGAAQAFLGPDSQSALGGFIAGHTYQIGAWLELPKQTIQNISDFNIVIAYYNAGAWSYITASPVAAFGSFLFVSATAPIPASVTGATAYVQIGTAEAAGAILNISDITLQDISLASEVQISALWNVYSEGLGKIVQAIQYSTPSETSAQSIITKNTYDSIGRLLQVAYKNMDSTYQGDGTFHVIKEISYDEVLNGVLTYDYIDDNAVDYIETDVYNDRLGRGPIKTVTYTGIGGTGLSRVTTNHYSHSGKLLKQDQPNGESFLYQYDNLGKLEKLTYPDGTAERYLYDLNGNLLQTIDRRNLSISVVYNQSDMEVSRTSIDSVRGNTVILTTYTQFGPAAVVKSEGAAQIVTDTYNYHWSGKPSFRQQVIDGYTIEVAYGFDAAGNVILVTPTGSGTSPWTHAFNVVPQYHPGGSDSDNFNRVAFADNVSGNNIITHESSFIGLDSSIKYGAYSALVGQITYKYDKYLRPISLISTESTPAISITLTRDFLGRIISHTEPAQNPPSAINYQYSYDGMNRVASGEGDTETYDELSNLIARAGVAYIYQDYTEPNQDQMRLASFNDGTNLYNYSYDANGNPVSISKGAGWRFSSLSFDNLNHLRQLVYTQTDNYWYDAGGKRIKKTENATGAWQTTYTMFEGDNPLMQEVYTASGRIQTIFNIIVKGKILAQYKMVYPSTLSVVYFYLDNLDSRRVVLSTTPAVIDRYHYSAWGVLTRDSGSDPYGSFTGKDYDATGLIYFNARYYDPTTGRFLTEDPSRQGVNWYAYCGNNPINKTDPTGLLSPDGVVDLVERANLGDTNAARMAASYMPQQSLGAPSYPGSQVGTIGISASGTVFGTSGAVTAGIYYRENAFGVYGGTEAGLGGGIAGSLTVTLGLYGQLSGLKGPYIAAGGSGGPPGISGGLDIVTSPKGKVTGAVLSLGIGIGTPAEGHARAGVTGILPFVGGSKDK